MSTLPGNLHEYKTVGPGIPACTCGEVFDWRHQFDDHQRANERAATLGGEGQ